MKRTQTSYPQRADQRDERLRALLALHFHPRYGSRYWLARQEKLGLNVRDHVRSLPDLWLLGPTSLDDLRQHSVRDFIPQAFHDQLYRFIIGETAGTTGTPCATAYRADEFQTAFVTPFLRIAERTGFPRGEPWLWVGPSGPHVIGKVVRELARQTGSMDPFSVDFDPRWSRRLAEGSLARQRYLDHVTEQALDVLRREQVGVLFITPPALAALQPKLTDRQREAIHGIHYGGMSMTAATVNRFREAFPNAVHLAGYGNTLFGVVMEVEDTPRQTLDYFPLGDRLHFEVVAWSEINGNNPAAWPPISSGRGQRGRVLVHRLDESCLLVGVIERDEAERITTSSAARALGATADGLRDPGSAATLGQRLPLGLY
jgi:phenylacetate-coenzyme A ligase PaaK-like adenylate-forming protein